MRMGWKQIFCKQILLTEKYLAENLKNYCLLNFSDIFHYNKSAKQLKNKMKWNKRNQICHIFHVNAWNIADLILHLTSDDDMMQPPPPPICYSL